jgi:hypothetical protein
MPSDPPSIPTHPTVPERLAALEERTTPRPKTIIDRVKDWGGVASLVIAIGYSFPLGIWEKFIEPEKKRTAAEIQSLRNVIEETIALLAESARTLSSIPDPYLRDTAGRAMNTRIYLQMTKNRMQFEKYKALLTPPELLIIGSNFSMTGQPEAGLPFLEMAQTKAGADVQSKFEAMRQRAKILFVRGPLQNRQESRKLFSEAIAEMVAIPHMNMKYASTSLKSEWAYFEMVDGDWMCGQEKLAESKASLKEIARYSNDNGNLEKLVTHITQSLSQQLGQPAIGCQ